MLITLAMILASTLQAAPFNNNISCYKGELKGDIYHLSFEGQAAQYAFDFLSQSSVKKISSDFSEKREGLAITCTKEGEIYSCSQQFDIQGGGPDSPGMVPEVKSLPAVAISYIGHDLQSFWDHLLQGASGELGLDIYDNPYEILIGRRITCEKQNTITCSQFVSPNGTIWRPGTDAFVGAAGIQQTFELHACQT
jgi:hypothetical protein